VAVVGCAPLASRSEAGEVLLLLKEGASS
jgi:hypothetical protein